MTYIFKQVFTLLSLIAYLRKIAQGVRKPLVAAAVLLCVLALLTLLLMCAPECKPWLGAQLKLFCQTLTVLTLPMCLWFSNNVLLFHFKRWLEAPTPRGGFSPRRCRRPGASGILWNNVLHRINNPRVPHGNSAHHSEKYHPDITWPAVT